MNYLQLDDHGFILGYSFSDAPPAQNWQDFGDESDLSYTMTGEFMCRVVNGEIVETSIPRSPPAAWLTFEDGEWRDLRSSAERAMHARETRNRLLLESDWTQMPDVTLSNKQAWADYRQALRDITDQPGYPLEITWPTHPGAQS